MRLSKRKTKTRVKWEQEFNALVDAFMREKRATEKDPAQPDFIIAGDREPMGADWMIETKGGPLKVMAYGDWVACRFDDPQKAKAALDACGLGTIRLNRFSGKWNHHFNVSDPIYSPKDCVHFFKGELLQIL